MNSIKEFKNIRNKLGVKILRQKLELVFAEHLKSGFPDIFEAIEMNILDIGNELKELGEEFMDENERRIFVIKNTGEFSDRYVKGLSKIFYLV